MQNAAPLPSCPRESWTEHFRPADHYTDSWRVCSLDLKNSSTSSQENPWDSVGTNGSLFDLQTSGRSANAKMLQLEQDCGQMFYQYNPVDYESNENLRENVVPALNATTVAWSAPSYCNITTPANGFREDFNTKMIQNDAAKAEIASLLNANNVNIQEFDRERYTRAQSAVRQFGSDSLTAGYGVKMEDSEISVSNAVSAQTRQMKPTFHWSDAISCSANANDAVKDSAPVASGDDLLYAFPRRTEECEESAPGEHKRASCTSEDGDHAGPSKKIRPSEAPLKAQVRKEKLGERITALQQLVSPFGKTDTASVLLEAIGYIKFLQDQVQVLSTPYLKGFPSSQTPEGRGLSGISGLRSRGLCLMPISSTHLVANNNGADFWASGIGGGTRF